MGPKPSEKLKTRQATYKCDACGRNFINTAALRTHYRFNHENKTAGVTKTVFRPHVLRKTIQKKIVVTKKDESVRISRDSDNTQKESEVLPPKAAPTRRIEFECPACSKVFPVYFSAHKHVQKHHCVDKNGVKVDPDSPDLIKPIRIELCESCRERISSSEEHNCDDTNLMYRCLGCGAGVETLTAFEQHVKDVHVKGLQTLYFSSPHACASWRKQIEITTGISYLPLKKKKELKSFRCPHQTSMVSGKIQLCPSLIVITECSTGYDINYYKQHFGHKIDRQIQVSELEPTLEEKRKHFKQVLTDILKDSTDVNDDTLKSLMGKAVQMVLVLENYKKEKSATKNMNINDEEISTELNNTKDVRNKRSSLVRNDPGAKKIKNDILNNSEAKEVTPVIENKRRVTRHGSSNPTQNTKLEEKDTPNSNKKVTTAQIEKELTVDKERDSSVLRTHLKSPPSFNDTYKSFVDETILKELDGPPRRTRRKSIMKTRIGQFKPSLSPKSQASSPVSKPSTPVPQTKPLTPIPQITKDIKYEVKEQENDCNILILKI